MDALTDLKTLGEMIKEIVWAPNKAFGTMMKKDAERFAERFNIFVTPEDEGKLEQALEYAVLASGSVAEKEHYKYNSLTCWAVYEQSLRVKIRNNDPEKNPML